MVRVALLYVMCGRIVCLCVAFVCAMLQRFGEKFVNFERIFLYEPCLYAGCFLPTLDLLMEKASCITIICLDQDRRENVWLLTFLTDSERSLNFI